MPEITIHVLTTWRIGGVDVGNFPAHLQTCRRYRLCLFVLFSIEQSHACNAGVQFRHDPTGISEYGVLADLWSGQRKRKPACLRSDARDKTAGSRSNLVLRISAISVSGDCTRSSRREAYRQLTATF